MPRAVKVAQRQKRGAVSAFCGIDGGRQSRNSGRGASRRAHWRLVADQGREKRSGHGCGRRPASGAARGPGAARPLRRPRPGGSAAGSPTTRGTGDKPSSAALRGRTGQRPAWAGLQQVEASSDGHGSTDSSRCPARREATCHRSHQEATGPVALRNGPRHCLSAAVAGSAYCDAADAAAGAAATGSEAIGAGAATGAVTAAGVA